VYSLASLAGGSQMELHQKLIQARGGQMTHVCKLAGRKLNDNDSKEAIDDSSKLNESNC